MGIVPETVIETIFLATTSILMQNEGIVREIARRLDCDGAVERKTLAEILSDVKRPRLSSAG